MEDMVELKTMMGENQKLLQKILINGKQASSSGSYE